MARVIIIGAGLTGLSAAYHLEKKGFNDYLIVEKESVPGGLCRSIKQGGFTFDYTGHLLHSSDDYFHSFLGYLLGDNLKSLQRRSFIHSHETCTPYPYQINLHGLPVETIIDCIEGYVNRRSSRRRPKSFDEWVLKFFGQGLARSFFFPYQSKLLQFDPRKLAASWTGRFVPQTSLRQMLRGALVRDNREIGYNAAFLYPRVGGIQHLIDLFVMQLRKQIITKTAVGKIDLQNRVVTFTNGQHEPFDLIINTMPLDQLLCCLHDRASNHFKNAAQKLLCTSVACLNLGISRSVGDDKHWIYYPEKQYPFYRLGFYHNFSAASVPPGCSSMYVECSYRNRSERSISHLICSARAEVKKLFDLEEHEIMVENILRVPHAYVVYDFWRERNLKRLLARLEQEGIYSIGRYGGWKYTSMQESVLDGKRIAEIILVYPARRGIFCQKSKHEGERSLRSIVTQKET